MTKHIAEPIKSKKDIQAVEKYLKEHNERNYVIWVLGLNSGLRVSDICGLNVSDVVIGDLPTTEKSTSFGNNTGS